MKIKINMILNIYKTNHTYIIYQIYNGCSLNILEHPSHPSISTGSRGRTGAVGISCHMPFAIVLFPGIIMYYPQTYRFSEATTIVQS